MIGILEVKLDIASGQLSAFAPSEFLDEFSFWKCYFLTTCKLYCQCRCLEAGESDSLRFHLAPPTSLIRPITLCNNLALALRETNPLHF